MATCSALSTSPIARAARTFSPGLPGCRETSVTPSTCIWSRSALRSSTRFWACFLFRSSAARFEVAPTIAASASARSRSACPSNPAPGTCCPEASLGPSSTSSFALARDAISMPSRLPYFSGSLLISASRSESESSFHHTETSSGVHEGSASFARPADSECRPSDSAYCPSARALYLGPTVVSASVARSTADLMHACRSWYFSYRSGLLLNSIGGVLT